MASNHGLVLLNTSSLPPIMKVSVPPSAPPFDPVQGASRNSMPMASSSAAIWLLSSGDTVLQSAMTYPRLAPLARPLAPLARPLSPRMTPRDMAVSPTQRKAQSLFSATCFGVAQKRAPVEAASSFALFWLLDHTATSWPAMTRCRAMGPPMMPSPKNPSFATRRCSCKTIG